MNIVMIILGLFLVLKIGSFINYRLFRLRMALRRFEFNLFFGISFVSIIYFLIK